MSSPFQKRFCKKSPMMRKYWQKGNYAGGEMGDEGGFQTRKSSSSGKTDGSFENSVGAVV